MDFIKNIKGNELPDQILVEQYKATGDMEVLATLYQRYMDLLYGVCFKYLKDPARAKDAVMQVFEELVQKLKQHEVQQFRSWVFTVAKNYCLMQLRTPKNLKTVEFRAEDMQSEAEMHQDNMMEREENLGKLEKCIEGLAPEQKTSVQLFYLENKCYKEISEITGMEWNTIRSFIQNGRRNLKICMEKKSDQKRKVN